MKWRGRGWILAALVMLTCALSEAQPNPTALVERFKTEPALDRQLDIAKEIIAFNDPSVLPQLRPLLTDPDRHLRGGAAFIFAGLGDGVGLDTIIEILNDISPDRVRRLPNVFSGGINKNSIPPPQPLARQIHDDRFYAVYLLGQLKDRRAVAALVSLLPDDQVGYEIARVLGDIGGEEAVDGLLLALRAHYADTRVFAILSIEKLGAKRAIPQLRALLNDHGQAVSGGRIVADVAGKAIATLEKR